MPATTPIVVDPGQSLVTDAGAKKKITADPV
jgi:hypothetical protein